MAKRASAKRPPKGPRPAKAIRGDPMREFVEAFTVDGVRSVGLLDDSCLSHVPAWVPSGSLALDRLLNGRGWPCGRIVELYGPQHIGKSTLLDMAFRQVQAMGGFGVLLDTEAARDAAYTIKGLGVDPARLQTLEFDDPAQVSIESCCDKIIATVDFWREKYPDVPIVLGLDSLGGLPAQSEAQKAVGDRVVAAAAKAMRDALRKLVQRLARSRVALIIVNHQYTDIQSTRGGFTARQTYAGQALRLAASIRLELSPRAAIKGDDGVVLGREVMAKLEKNRHGWCREVKVAVLAHQGVADHWTLYHDLKDAGLIEQSGGWSKLTLPERETLSWQGGWQRLGARAEADPPLGEALRAAWALNNPDQPVGGQPPLPPS